MDNDGPIIPGDPSTWPTPPDRKGPWGKWVFNEEYNTLEYQQFTYSIPLEPLKTTAQVLDIIAQFAGKPSVPSEDVGDLVRAINARLRLQANYCGGGRDLTADN